MQTLYSITIDRPFYRKLSLKYILDLAYSENDDIKIPVIIMLREMLYPNPVVQSIIYEFTLEKMRSVVDGEIDDKSIRNRLIPFYSTCIENPYNIAKIFEAYVKSPDNVFIW